MSDQQMASKITAISPYRTYDMVSSSNPECWQVTSQVRFGSFWEDDVRMSIRKSIDSSIVSLGSSSYISCNRVARDCTTEFNLGARATTGRLT